MAYEVYIDDKDLERLYTGQKTKKLDLPPKVVDKFFATIQKLESATGIHDLLADKGMRFEKMKQTENEYSIRLDKKYRLEMTIHWEDEKMRQGKIYLKRISNHYGD